MLKKFFILLCTILLLGCIGCANTQKSDYPLCNTTSKYKMIETEDGFFYVYNKLLYYADKSDMSFWVPVCNKPNCQHKPFSEFGDEKCNAEFPTNTDKIVQKNGKFYSEYYSDGLAIYEILTDGSGAKCVYELPIEEDIKKSSSRGYSIAFSRNQFIVAYHYLDEFGRYPNYLVRLTEDSFEILSQSTEESYTVMSGNTYFGLRGDDTYIFLHEMEEGKTLETTKRLWRIMEDGSIEEVNFPEYIERNDFIGAYLLGDTFTYFIENEGFYECDLKTGEKTLLYKNQLEDSEGYVLSEDYMVEWNHETATPEQQAIKVYNGETWIDVEILDEIKNSSDNIFPAAVASDRMFFRMNVQKDDSTTVPFLYYFMLEEENPKLIACGSFDEEVQIQGEEETERNEVVFTPQDVTIFDSEHCLLKVTGLYIDDKTGEIQINTTLDLKGNWIEEENNRALYNIMLDSVIMNGIEFHPESSLYSKIILQVEEEQKALETGTDVKEEQSYQLHCDKEMLEQAGILQQYAPNEYVDIELKYTLCTRKYQTIETASIHLYPQGEEHAKDFVQEDSNANILINNAKFKISVSKYEESLIPNDTVTLLIENKTDTGLAFRIPERTINGVGTTYQSLSDNEISTFVGAGNKTYFTITIHTENIQGATFLEETGITEVYSWGLLFDVYSQESMNDAREYITSESVVFYPNDSVNVVPYEREVQSTDTVLVDNESITLIAVGYEETSSGLKNGKVKLYLKNKTNKTVYFSPGDKKYLQGDGIVNGVETNVSMVGDIYILPESSSYFPINFSVPSDKTVAIAEELEFLCKVRAYEEEMNYEAGQATGEVLVEELCKCYPNK